MEHSPQMIRRWAGNFDLIDPLVETNWAFVSGNAKQRRLIVRRLKRMGYTVTKWDSWIDKQTGNGVSYG